MNNFKINIRINPYGDQIYAKNNNANIELEKEIIKDEMRLANNKQN
jgi:hypothetical protein